eukprot:2678664-Prymnesium_polylepis.1
MRWCRTFRLEPAFHGRQLHHFRRGADLRPVCAHERGATRFVNSAEVVDATVDVHGGLTSVVRTLGQEVYHAGDRLHLAIRGVETEELNVEADCIKEPGHLARIEDARDGVGVHRGQIAPGFCVLPIYNLMQRFYRHFGGVFPATLDFRSPMGCTGWLLRWKTRQKSPSSSTGCVVRIDGLSGRVALRMCDASGPEPLFPAPRISHGVYALPCTAYETGEAPSRVRIIRYGDARLLG